MGIKYNIADLDLGPRIQCFFDPWIPIRDKFLPVSNNFFV
jgi:hypothetical protein